MAAATDRGGHHRQDHGDQPHLEDPADAEADGQRLALVPGERQRRGPQPPVEERGDRQGEGDVAEERTEKAHRRGV
jgi:hypothetical protein